MEARKHLCKEQWEKQEMHPSHFLILKLFFSSLHWQDWNDRVTACSNVFHPLTSDLFSQYQVSHSGKWKLVQLGPNSSVKLAIAFSDVLHTYCLIVNPLSALWKVKHLFNSTPTTIMSKWWINTNERLPVLCNPETLLIFSWVASPNYESSLLWQNPPPNFQLLFAQP